MVAALKSLASKDMARRLAAWWNGQEVELAAATDDTAAPAAAPAVEPADTVTTLPVPAVQPEKQASTCAPGDVRLAALEVLWGEGRFAPSLSTLCDAVGTLEAGAEGDLARLGIINGDPALVRSLMGSSGAAPVICEWRKPVRNRFLRDFPDFDCLEGELDRLPFSATSLAGLVSVDAFTYADHKAGLAVRALKALKPGAQWTALDLVRESGGASLKAAFASAWAEPQLTDVATIEELASSAGLECISPCETVTAQLVGEIENGLASFSDTLEERLTSALKSLPHGLLVREIAWEAESWKWRGRALEAGLISARLWRFRRPD